MCGERRFKRSILCLFAIWVVFPAIYVWFEPNVVYFFGRSMTAEVSTDDLNPQEGHFLKMSFLRVPYNGGFAVRFTPSPNRPLNLL
jgi:hypothetical protein